jgi:hypothetical protein
MGLPNFVDIFVLLQITNNHKINPPLPTGLQSYYRHAIAEILLKVALNTKNQSIINQSYLKYYILY